MRALILGVVIFAKSRTFLHCISLYTYEMEASPWRKLPLAQNNRLTSYGGCVLKRATTCVRNRAIVLQFTPVV